MADIEGEKPTGDQQPPMEDVAQRLFTAAKQLGITPLGLFAAKLAQDIRLRQQISEIIEGASNMNGRDSRHDPPPTS